MKPKTGRALSITFIFWLIACFSPGTVQSGSKSLMAQLENINARQAVAFANAWRWTHPGIKMYVDSRELVFKFPDGQVKKISMPADQMLVAVAPYIKQTHT